MLLRQFKVITTQTLCAISKYSYDDLCLYKHNNQNNEQRYSICIAKTNKVIANLSLCELIYVASYIPSVLRACINADCDKDSNINFGNDLCIIDCEKLVDELHSVNCEVVNEFYREEDTKDCIEVLADTIEMYNLALTRFKTLLKVKNHWKDEFVTSDIDGGN